MNELAQKTLELAAQSVGVHEESPNYGKWIRVYLNFVGIYEPAPWCCAWLIFKVHQAARALGVKSKLPKTASCQALRNWAGKRGLIRNIPQAGDIGLVWHPELKRYAHVFFVESVDGRMIHTIEGNSNTDGSREGKAVVRNRRTRSGRFVYFAPV